MFCKRWESKNLIFETCSFEEADLLRDIFSANSHLIQVDPTFQDWPLSEYRALIEKDSKPKDLSTPQAFYLRKIIEKCGDVVGYVQLELNAPYDNICWLPMLVFSPTVQGKGYGKEAIESLIRVINSYGCFTDLQLNVYVENVRAFRFWFNNGFRSINAFEKEYEHGREYNCLVLSRTLTPNRCATANKIKSR